SKQVTVNVETYQASCDGSTYCYGCPSKTIQVTPYDNTLNDYQWYENGVAVPGATGAAYTISLGSNETIKQASVHCTVSRKNGSCAPGRSNVVEVTLVKNCKYSRNAAEDAAQAVATAGWLHLFPNPTTGNFAIAYRFAEPTQVPVIVTVYDLFGKIWRRQSASGDQPIVLSETEPLPAGIYLVQVCSPAQCLSGRLIISR
ncbi:MAG: T9SS type A sorting domain-containing protein, partial [Chitinophagales bacterium]|nr:T9SS type A sorting domain-containing protein [Chitinophagales bacterium]MDW8427349.1 T9SS type A sorting domain-containing protein [Chitinophagales bacterium]